MEFKLIKNSNPLGVKDSISKKLVVLTATIPEMNQLLNIPAKILANQKRLTDSILSDSKAAWRGGTLKQATAMPDMAPYLQAKTELMRGGLFKSLAPVYEHRPKRKRVNSEYDGDFDFDRKWEIKPFSTTKQIKVPIPIIKINIFLGVNCGYSPESYNKYSALAWAVTQLIESHGVNTEISYSSYAIGSCNGSVDYYQTGILKEATKYLSPQSLAYALRTSFLRRHIFAGIIHGSDYAKLPVLSTLGRAPGLPYCAKYENGTLYLAPNLADNPEALKTELSKILKTV